MPYQYSGNGPIWIATEPGVQSIIAPECSRAVPAGQAPGHPAPGTGRPYPSGHMAEFQWWLLIVGLVAGGGLVAVVSMDSRRRNQDISELEQHAEATWIAEQLARRGGPDAETVETVLRAHRDYLSLQPPDRLIVEVDDVAADAAP